MKRNLFLLLFAIATLSTFAQTTSEHLTFKGVPIDGTLTEFVSKLKTERAYSHWHRRWNCHIKRRFCSIQKLYSSCYSFKTKEFSC